MFTSMWAAICVGLWATTSSGYALHSRQDTREFCGNGSYSTPIGLSFDVTCGWNIGMGHDITSMGGDNITDCMMKCSEFQPLPGQPPCRAVVFASETSWCWLKDRNWTTTDLYEQEVSDMAVADRTQLQPLDTSCPFPNNSIQQTVNGESFKISCGYDSLTDEFDGGIDSYYQAHHAESLQDCMTWCSDGNPLCYGVVFNADLERGYRNCYPKSANTTAHLVKSQWVMHTATLLNTAMVEGVANSSSPSNGSNSGNDNNTDTANTNANSSSGSTTTSTKPASKAWIAGAVAGPLAGVVLIAAASLFLRRRRIQRNSQPMYVPGSPVKEPMSSVEEVPAYHDSVKPRTELDSSLHKSPGDRNPARPYEME